MVQAVTQNRVGAIICLLPVVIPFLILTIAFFLFVKTFLALAVSAVLVFRFFPGRLFGNFCQFRRQRQAAYLAADQFFNALEAASIFAIDQGDGYA